jgi:hypothetical protein
MNVHEAAKRLVVNPSLIFTTRESSPAARSCRLRAGSGFCLRRVSRVSRRLPLAGSKSTTKGLPTRLELTTRTTPYATVAQGERFRIVLKDRVSRVPGSTIGYP